MSTRISGLYCSMSVRNFHASVKMATEPTFHCSGGQRGGHCWSCSEEDIWLRSLSTQGVRGLEGGTTPSVLLSISNCSVVLVLESKF